MTAMQMDPAKRRLMEAILSHVVFDGWSEANFAAAVAETGMTMAEARSLCPRGAVDLAVAYHVAGDAAMVAAVRAANLTHMRYRDKVAFAIRARLNAITDKEVVLRGAALFSLPHMVPEGARLTWGTADAIWTALGDRSDDINWYTKRATLAGVWASVVLFWLGDTSLDEEETDAFIDRRIEEVMQIEAAKARLRESRLLKPVVGPLGRVLGLVRAPARVPPMDLPGHWTPKTDVQP